MSFKFGVLANFVTFLRSLQYFPSSSGCCFFLDKVISIGDNGLGKRAEENITNHVSIWRFENCLIKSLPTSLFQREEKYFPL
jgi:hypothetical protein